MPASTVRGSFSSDHERLQIIYYKIILTQEEVVLQPEQMGSAKSVNDFTKELAQACEQTLAERQYARKKLIKHHMYQGKSKKQAGKICTEPASTRIGERPTEEREITISGRT